MREFQIAVVEICIQPKDALLLTEESVSVRLQDEGAGPFIEILNASGQGTVTLDIDMIDTFCEALKRIAGEVKL